MFWLFNRPGHDSLCCRKLLCGLLKLLDVLTFFVRYVCLLGWDVIHIIAIAIQ